MLFRRNLEKIAEIYEGVAVFSVAPGTTSHRAGMRAGDVLVAVNGRRVRRPLDYAVARSARQDLLQFVVMREGQQLTLWTASEETPRERSLQRPVSCGWRGSV